LEVTVPVVVALIIATAIGYFFLRRPPKLTDKDKVVLADFENKTGDAIFDGTLKQVLSVELGQSPFLNVLSDRKVTETLRMIGRPMNEHITADVGRELCLRTGSKALLDGTISSLGSRYSLKGARRRCCQPSRWLGAAILAERRYWFANWRKTTRPIPC
jgi:hypothetical protein